NPRRAVARSKHASRRQVYTPRPGPAPGASDLSTAWKRWRSPWGALRPHPVQVLIGRGLVGSDVSASLLRRDVLDRHAPVRVVLDADDRRTARLERLVGRGDRRVAGTGGEVLARFGL